MSGKAPNCQDYKLSVFDFQYRLHNEHDCRRRRDRQRLLFKTVVILKLVRRGRNVIYPTDLINRCRDNICDRKRRGIRSSRNGVEANPIFKPSKVARLSPDRRQIGFLGNNGTVVQLKTCTCANTHLTGMPMRTD